MTNMYFNKDKKVLWIFCLGIMITGLIISNMEAERILKQPFRNSLNGLEENFNSSASIVFFTSGFIWITCVILNLIEKRQENRKSENQWQSLEGIGKCSISKIQSSIIEQRKSQNVSKYSHHQENQHLPLQKSLSFSQSIKLFVPAFLQTYFFLSSLTHLSYPKVLVFKLLSSLGLVHLYSSLFTQTENKLSKFMLSIVAFAGFGIFNYFFVDTQEKQIEQKLYKKDVVQGYMWVVAMGYMGLLRKILDQKVKKQRKQSRQGIVNTIQVLKIQAKIHFILAYLLAIFLKQQIYTPVFAILHNGVFSNFLLFMLALFLSKFMKVYTLIHFKPALTKFLLIIQKNASLVISIIYFGQGINSGQLLGLSLISLMGYFEFQLDKNNRQN